MSDIKKVLLATPAHSGFVHTFVEDSQRQAIRHIDKNCPHIALDYRFMQRTMVDRARQSCHEHALKEGYDYIMWWDDDIMAPANVIEQLVSHDKDIVSAMLFVRTEPHPMYAYRSDNLQDLESYKSLTLEDRGGIVEVDVVGTGCTLMKVDIVKGLDRPWWQWPQVGAEDIAFCVRQRKRGIKVFVDTDLPTKHLEFLPTAVDHTRHAAVCNRIADMALHAPKIQELPDFAKVEYLLPKGWRDGAKRILGDQK